MPTIAAHRTLIDQTRWRFDLDRRALTTASNGSGVNAVFVQCVLNAALAQG